MSDVQFCQRRLVSFSWHSILHRVRSKIHQIVNVIRMVEPKRVSELVHSYRPHFTIFHISARSKSISRAQFNQCTFVLVACHLRCGQTRNHSLLRLGCKSIWRPRNHNISVVSFFRNCITDFFSRCLAPGIQRPHHKVSIYGLITRGAFVRVYVHLKRHAFAVPGPRVIVLLQKVHIVRQLITGAAQFLSVIRKC